MLAALALCVVPRPVLADAPPLAGADIPLDATRPPSQPGRHVLGAVAVHAPAGTPALEYLRVASHAAALLTELRERFLLPDPLTDGTRGGGPELDVYLRPDGPPSIAHLDQLEPWSLWDRATSFVSVRSALADDDLDHALATALAHAVLLGIDARAPSAWQVAMARTYARHLLGTGPDERAFTAFQRDPGARLLGAQSNEGTDGLETFADYLTRRFDSPELAMLRGLAWMPIARTPGDRPRMAPDPSVFDALERLLRAEPGGLDGVIARYSLARALVGTPADDLGFGGFALRPAPAPASGHEADCAHLPAWVRPTVPLDETGADYVLVDTAGCRGAAVDLWFHGAPWHRWRVTVARIARDGTLAGLMPDAPVDRGEWSSVIENVESLSQLIVVINALGDGRYGPWEPVQRDGVYALHLARSASGE